MLAKTLIATGLRFPDSGDELSFIEQYVFKQRIWVQVVVVLGALMNYTFFIWDRILDPIHSDETQIIRGLVADPVILLCGILMFLERFRKHQEYLSVVAVCTAGVSLSYIYTLIRSGFDHGAMGIILVIFVGAALVPFRLMFFIATVLVTNITFQISEVAEHNASPGMWEVNALGVWAAALIGLVGVGWREHSARGRFESDKALLASQSRVEELLHSMLPSEIVARIQSGDTAIADAYGEVSIVFADLVGFTELSRRLSATHLVEILNSLFSQFDALAEAYGVDRIKTIGDAYMAVGGLSRDKAGPDHARQSAQMALKMMDVVAGIAAKLEYPLDIRIGLHVGSVVAGVIGTKRPAFDCWGEAVNLASRLEGAAPPGAIVLSESAYWRLRAFFPTKVLEDVVLKGIGATKLYLLERPLAAESVVVRSLH